ncbi:hypothetical protein BGW80DRAFT_286908 [Lactifluus volemus]|nr:hypothetical protein BGW80DRAFT_286908 [Lactifluus volemus]
MHWIVLVVKDMAPYRPDNNKPFCTKYCQEPPPLTHHLSNLLQSVNHSIAIPTRRKTVPTGTRKNITPESLVPYEAPIQSRKYRLPSSTSRKELPATFSRKRAQTQVPGEGEDGRTLSEEHAIKIKHLQNNLATRRSRKRELEYQCELEDVIEAERKGKEMLRARAP